MDVTEYRPLKHWRSKQTVAKQQPPPPKAKQFSGGFNSVFAAHIQTQIKGITRN
jgi:hypothetical protein